MVCLEEERVHVVDGIPRNVAVMSRGNDQRLVHGDVAGHSRCRGRSVRRVGLGWVGLGVVEAESRVG
jgi:hypothetical protein